MDVSMAECDYRKECWLFLYCCPPGAGVIPRGVDTSVPPIGMGSGKSLSPGATDVERELAGVVADDAVAEDGMGAISVLSTRDAFFLGLGAFWFSLM